MQKGGATMKQYIYLIYFTDGAFQFYNNREALEGLNKSLIKFIYKLESNTPVGAICEYLGSSESPYAFERYGGERITI